MRLSKRGVEFTAALLISGFASSGGFAQDVPESRIEQAFSASLGVRYWFSTGQTGKDLYDSTGTVLLSRLTYDGLDTHSGEIFGQANYSRLFLKGNAGIGATVAGKLQDEDFPPVTTPYSSTDSEQDGGHIGYATIDLGGYLLSGNRGHLGGFVGYNYLHQEVNAFGCRQTATSTICVPTISTSVAVISQENDWHSLRLGLNGDVMLGSRLMLSAEGAWLPYVALDGADSHHLRICSTAGCFTGPVPEDGEGWGYQFEGMAEFMVTDRLSLGLGGRYWHMQTSGDTHFENHIVGGGGVAQDVDWDVDIYGVLAQAKIKF